MKETQKYNELLKTLADKINENIVMKSDIEHLVQILKGNKNG